MNFTLHPQLETDTLFIENLPLSKLLLMNDRRYPWFILVPRKFEITEVYQLVMEDQYQLLNEMNLVAKWAHKNFSADKMNIAALGNVVPQLHIHIIARHTNDFAWPKPVWGIGTKEEYSKEEGLSLIERIKQELVV